MYCLSLHNKNYKIIKELGYVPVGLGRESFSSDWLTDKNGDNISEKNPYYGEYSFHYWFWKNKIDKIKDGTWIGFCAYRRFWLRSKNTIFTQQKTNFLSDVPEEWNNYNVILGPQFFINKMSFSKMIKHGLRSLINYPPAIFEKKRNIKFHFDLMHGEGNLEKAISLLDHEYKKDFEEYVNTEVSFNPHNMFICNSKKILNDFYSVIFPWLERCENKFGFNLEGYGLKRIYGFLAERFMPFWFIKNFNTKTCPITFFDKRLIK